MKRKPLKKQCRKINYPSEQRARNASKRHDNYTRPYYCPQFKGWHLTSQTKKDYDAK